MTKKCVMCDEPAVCIRHTQFAGDHPFCEDHAKMEEDFGVNDSYAYWSMPEEIMDEMVKPKA
jgi:hypothetical protein